MRKKRELFVIVAIVAVAAGINIAAYKIGAHTVRHPSSVYQLHVRPAARSPLLVYRSRP